MITSSSIQIIDSSLKFSSELFFFIEVLDNDLPSWQSDGAILQCIFHMVGNHQGCQMILTSWSHLCSIKQHWSFGSRAAVCSSTRATLSAKVAIKRLNAWRCPPERNSIRYRDVSRPFPTFNGCLKLFPMAWKSSQEVVLSSHHELGNQEIFATVLQPYPSLDLKDTDKYLALFPGEKNASRPRPWYGYFHLLKVKVPAIVLKRWLPSSIST